MDAGLLTDPDGRADMLARMRSATRQLTTAAH
jgi:hypothetical protein